MNELLMKMKLLSIIMSMELLGLIKLLRKFMVKLLMSSLVKVILDLIMPMEMINN